MFNLKNLSIRNKFFLIVFPLIFGLLLLVILRTRVNLLRTADLEKFQNAIALSVKISEVVHEIQKERGNSSGFLSNKGEIFKEQLAAQRRLTDELIFELDRALGATDNEDIVIENEKGLNELKGYLNRIPTYRSIVDELGFTPNQAIDAYTEINTFALNYLHELIPPTSEPLIILKIQGFFNFLKAKERAGIERAIGAQAFSLGYLDDEVYKRFATLVAQQEAFLGAFKVSVPIDYVETYNGLLSGKDVEEVERMREILFANKDLTEDPLYWFESITGKIEKLKIFENFMAESVVNDAAQFSTSALRQFYIFLIIAVVLLVLDLFIMYLVLFDLLSNVNKLVSFSEKVGKGDYQGQVTIKTKDEIGSFAKVLNETVAAIKESQGALKDEKVKAEDLYENIYKTSEVVFENVKQGIFLLKSDLSISNLHSNETLSILDKTSIKGANFLDILKPILVPRDFESLKIFSKQLFNSKVKSKVLDRLNPLEEIKIFSEGSKEKYIKVEFNRINEGNEIRDVMVTLLDITESVQLQNKIRENEEKKAMEAEQLLSIIKIDPYSLREFLIKGGVAIDEIYQRYEEDKTSDFSEIVHFTFNIIHNLKGNASLIELNMIEDRLNKIEDALSELRGGYVKGENFVPVLYEISELKSSLGDIEGMLNKIVSIYHQLTSGDNIGSNDKFMLSLERKAKRIGAEVGKKVNLLIYNEEGIIIPDTQKLQINDMLIQLMRNSIIHGIETPSARKALGKDEYGEIAITFNKDVVDGNLNIKYEDDGQGLNRKQIAQKAVELGLISEEMGTSNSDTEIFQLIFEDGFSTAQKGATKHAGRGQGMNFIKMTLDRINGAFEIHSKAGERFEIIMKVPLTEKPTIQSIDI